MNGMLRKFNLNKSNFNLIFNAVFLLIFLLNCFAIDPLGEKEESGRKDLIERKEARKIVSLLLIAKFSQCGLNYFYVDVYSPGEGSNCQSQNRLSLKRSCKSKSVYISRKGLNICINSIAVQPCEEFKKNYYSAIFICQEGGYNGF